MGELALSGLEGRRLVRSGIGLGLLLILPLALLLFQGGSDLPAADDPLRKGGALRQGLWEFAVLWLVPGVALHAAARVERWRAGEADWLAPRIDRLRALAATALGLVVGSALLALLPALVSSATPRHTGSDSADRLLVDHHLGQTAPVPPQQSLQLALDPDLLPASGRLRLRVGRGPGGSRTRDLRLVLLRAGASHEATATLQGPMWLELPLPPGDGPLAIGLRNEGEGSLQVRGQHSVQVFGRETSALARGADAWLRAVRTLAVIAAMALAFGAWMGPGPAAGLALTLPLALGQLTGPSPWLPWSDLLPALGMLGEGRLPMAPGPLPWLATVLWVFAALLLGRLGLRQWTGR